MEIEKNVVNANAGIVSYKIKSEDYTLVEPLVFNLRKDPRVTYVGYIKDHPLDDIIEIKIRIKKNRIRLYDGPVASEEQVIAENLRGLIETLESYKKQVEESI